MPTPTIARERFRLQDAVKVMSDETHQARPRNRLAEASSPYLLQHADNPVAWLPWGDDAFRRAEREGRPLFLSIGYSTCHWCHVMAHESFEDEEVAELLNEHFVPVKVDREERPDVDKVYMTACQLMTGQGGWPLTVVATPEGDPFFAGTYFPKRGRGGRPGLMDVLGRLAQVWEDDREQATEAAGRVRRALERAAAPDAGGDGRGRRARPGLGGGPAGMAVEGETEPAIGADVADAAYRRLAGQYDEAEGGFGGPPKFPSPHNLVFLLRHADRTGEARAREMAAETLRKMGRGGIRDHVGGGFHRYSTDARWLVPHFEKMLYDQALLTLAHVEGARATGDPRLLATAADTMEYVIRDLRDPSGGFHAAEDADSEGGEGKFYLWTEEELRQLLGEDEVRLVKSVFNTRPGGNFAEEATGRKTGENILHRRGSLEEAAEREGMEVDELRERLTAVRERLYEAREERPRPHRDDKILTDWNGLAIGALARTATALAAAPDGAVRPTLRLDAAGRDGPDASRFLDAAVDAAEFLLSELRDANGRLLHRWREGKAGVKANADDYAFLVWGLLELYDATLRPRWLEAALELQEQMEQYCRDAERGGYFFAPSDGERLVVRQKEFHDGAIPSANSIALWNLRRLERLTGRTEWGERADRLEGAAAPSLERAPTGHTGLLVGVDVRLGTGHEVVLAGPAAALETHPADGDAPDRDGDAGHVLRQMVRIVRSGYRPRTVTLLRPTDDPDAAERVARLASYTAEMEGVDGRAAAYVCRDFTCDAPTTDPAALAEALGAPGAAP